MDNGHKGKEGEEKRWCPHEHDWCKKGGCALWGELTESAGGMQRKIEVCTYIATNILLLKIIQKLVEKENKGNIQKIVLPGMRG